MAQVCINVSELARRLGISRPTAYALAKRRDFPSFRVGNRILVPIKPLEDWLERQAANSSNE